MHTSAAVRQAGLVGVSITCVIGVLLWPEPEVGARPKSERLAPRNDVLEPADGITAEGAAGGTWPQWRGPLATGASPEADPPVLWSENENVRWKTPLPGLGHSTPVVWGDRIFLTAAAPIGPAMEARYSGAPGAHDNAPITHRHQFLVMAVSLRTGQLLWERPVAEAVPHEGGHLSGSLASGSPATDGESVYASFGSYGLFCLTMDGEIRWQKDLGTMHTKHGHGEGSSPVLYGDWLIVNWDHEGNSFLAAFDARTGEQRWRRDRNEVTSWATPLVVEVEGRPQIVVCGTDRVRGYDLNSGDVLWECGGLSANIVATPVAADGVVYVGSSYDTRAMLAISLEGARGDITYSDHVLWRRTRGTPYVPSPLLYEGHLYFLRHYQGILTRVEAVSGEERPGPLRLGAIRNVYASPVAAAGRIYVTDLDGVTMVISAEDFPRVLAVNELDEPVSASGVPVGRTLLLRGHRHLYCLEETPEPQSR